ncbi:MAG: STAS domain-containing protein [Phycisphaerales bacterium]
MGSVASRLNVRVQSGVTRVEFVDRNILDETNIAQIGEELGRLVDGQTTPKLLISFKGVEHLSSAALGTLITVNNRVKGKDGQLRLSDIDPQIYEVFVITKLNRLFHIHDSAEKALASFS